MLLALYVCCAKSFTPERQLKTAFESYAQACQKNADKINAYIFIIPQNVVAEKTNHKKKHGNENDQGGMKCCAQREGER